MDFLKKNKTLTGVLILGAFFVVAMFLYSSTNNASSSAVDAGVIESDTTQPLIEALASLSAIRLDGAIFSDPVFVSLTDFGVVIPLQPVGRRNPFLPIGKAPTVTGQ